MQVPPDLPEYLYSLPPANQWTIGTNKSMAGTIPAVLV